MKGRWKRFLAALLTACMLLGDSSFAYAAESIAAEDSSEQATENETEESTDEATVEEPEIQEDTEEPQTEEENEDQEPAQTDETNPEDNVVDEDDQEPEELSEIEEEPEVQLLSTQEQWIQVGQEFETGIIDEDDWGYFTEKYYFKPTKSGNYGFNGVSKVDFYVKTGEESWQWLDGEGITYYKFADDDSQSVIKYWSLESGKTYKLRIREDVPSNTNLKFSFLEDEIGDTATELKLDGKSVMLLSGEKRMFYSEISKSLMTEIVAENPIDIQCYEFDASKVGINAIEFAESGKYYFSLEIIGTSTQCDVSLKTVKFEEIELGKEVEIASSKNSYFTCKVEENVYYLKHNADVSVNFNFDGTSVGHINGITDKNGNNWSYFQFSKSRDVYIVVGGGTSNGSFLIQKESPLEEEVLTSWSGTISVPAHSEKTIRYKGEIYGDWLIQAPEEDFNVNVLNDLQVSSFLGDDKFVIDDKCYLVFEIGASSKDDKIDFAFQLTNYTDEEQIFTLLTNEDMTTEKLEEGIELELRNHARYYQFGYFKIQPNETKVYEIDGCDWIYCVEERHLYDENAPVLERGKTYYAKITSTCPVSGIALSETSGKSMKTTLGESFQVFIPSVTGNYDCDFGADMRIWNSEEKCWDYFTGEGVSLTQGKKYVIHSYVEGVLGLKAEITVLDYDYYTALVASGGSVTIDDNGVTINPGTGKFTFIKKLLSILGIVTYEQSDKTVFKDANEYWKNVKDGAFAAAKFYKIEGSGKNQKLVEYNSPTEAEQGDVVVVKYEPEIVWVDSMEVSADKTSLTPSGTTQLHVTAKAATEKYPFKETPIFTYSSSNDDILTVDENGKVTAHKNGTATITVTADKDLREEEGCLDRLVTKTIALTVDNGCTSDYEYEILQDGTISLTGYNKKDDGEKKITIPNEIAGFKVSTIGKNAFSNLTALEELTISEGITKIEEFAFLDCVNLEKICLPDSLKAISDLSFVVGTNEEGVYEQLEPTIYASKKSYAYQWAEEKRIACMDPKVEAYKLVYEVLEDDTISIKRYVGDLPNELIIPETIDGHRVTEIGMCAFENCTELTKVTLPDNITSINFSAFMGCTGLKEINMPSKLVTIGNAAFRQCSSLKKIKLPEDLESLGSFAFGECSSLEEINFPGKLKTVANAVIWECDSLTSVTLPESIKTIEYHAFSDCDNLKEVLIPEGVKTIDRFAFWNCKSLKEIVLPNSIESIGDYAFSKGNLEQKEETYVNMDLVIGAYTRNYAYTWAKEHGFNVKLIPLKVDVDVWSGAVDVPANSSIDISYSGSYCGDYFIQLPEDITGSFESWDSEADIIISASCTQESIQCNSQVVYSNIDDEWYYNVFSLVKGNKEYDGETSAEFVLRLTNFTDEEQTISLMTNEDIGGLYSVGDGVINTWLNYAILHQETGDQAIGYYAIEPEKTAIYRFSDFDWLYCIEDRILFTAKECCDDAMLLEDGKTYYAKFTSRQKIVAEDWNESEGKELEFNEDQKFYLFIPSESGMYYYEGISGGKSVWNNEKKMFEFFSGSKGIELEAGVSYVFFADSMQGTLGLRSEITVLDYDYYTALIASGGSVTIDDNGVTINPGTGKFTFIKKLLSIFGIVEYEQTDKDAFADANTYWKNAKDGAFAAAKFYKIKGNGKKQTLVEYDSQTEAEEGDVVVVKYEPEIVWVDSMEVSADTADLAPGDTIQLQVTAKAATEKYPFKEEPVFTYTSSDESILTVDAQGKVTAHKTGTATITVIADEALREAEDCIGRLVTKKIKITVGSRYQIIYENVNGLEGSLNDGSPLNYNSQATTALVDPIANDGYEFVGWYSDAKLTKKITSIPKNSTGNKTIYAKWKLHEYTINYELNGGQFPDTYPTTFTIEGGTVLKVPAKYGYQFVGWTADEGLLDHEEGSTDYTIKAGITENITLLANWSWSTKAALKINKLGEDNSLFCSYDAVSKKWVIPEISFTVVTTPAGIEIDTEALNVALYEKNNEKPIWTWTGGDTLNIPEETIPGSGTYVLKGSFQHGEESVPLEEAEFTVTFEKRDYPINKKLSWTGISNILENETFDGIYEEIITLAQPTKEALLKGESLQTLKVTEIRNAKNQAVKGNAKLTSGTYTVIFGLDTNDNFTETAAATLEIVYSPLKLTGVEYVTADESGRTAGSTIAFPVADANKTAYPTKVKICPVFETPWDICVYAGDLSAHLSEHGYEGASVSVTAAEAKSKTALLKLDTDEYGNIIAEAAGTTAGKRNVTVSAEIKGLKLSTTIKNFTVVSGDVEATREIGLTLKDMSDNKQDPNQTVDDVPVYLFGKQTTAVNLKLAYETFNYEGSKNEAKLTWKSSNTKIASVKTVKNADYVTVTLPKNATGVVEITATANDAAKNSQSIQLIIVDTGMCLDTTSVTLNSLAVGDRAVAYLYPNVLAQDLGTDAANIQEQFKTENVKLYKKVKNGYESYDDVFKTTYDVTTGEFGIAFKEKGTKAQTYTAYIGAASEGTQPSEYYAIKIKDTYKMPKAPTVQVTGAYEIAYKGSSSLTLKLTANAKVEDIKVLDERFKITDTYSSSDDTEWTLTIEATGDAKESVFPTGKQTSKTTKGVKFVVSYADYKNEHTVSTNITVTNTQPKLSVYGRYAYTPVYYTDTAMKYVTVAIPIDARLLEGYDYETEEITETGDTVIFKDSNREEIAKVSLKDPAKFEIVQASYESDTQIYSKKTPVLVNYAMILTVRVKDNQKKNVSLQFDVESHNLTNSSKITTGKLTVKASKLASEAFTWVNADTNASVKNLTFNSAFQGKESVKLMSVPADSLIGALGSLSNSGSSLNDSLKLNVTIEGSDAKSREMLRKNALQTVFYSDKGIVQISTTDTTFNYTSAKLKLTYHVTVGDDVVNLKSNVINLSFKKALTPKLTLSDVKMIRGLTANLMSDGNVYYVAPSVNVSAKLTNMPVGYTIRDIRLTDAADMEKYTIDFDADDEYSGAFTLNARCDVLPSLGKDKIEVAYDICTVTGEIVTVNTSFTLTVADSASLKSDVSSINLYNSVVGNGYGKDVTFRDAKGHAVCVEILNADELKKAGLSFEAADDVKGYLDTATLKCYVDKDLKRGAEKTYTVKAKVAVIGAVDGGNREEISAKTITFKIVLKK